MLLLQTVCCTRRKDGWINIFRKIIFLCLNFGVMISSHMEGVDWSVSFEDSLLMIIRFVINLVLYLGSRSYNQVVNCIV